MPSRSQKAGPGNRERTPGSMSNKLRFTGNAAEENLRHYLSGEQADYLTASYDTSLPVKNNSWLGRLYQGYDTPEPETLHYTNRYLQSADQRYQLALLRPSVNVELQTLHLPGCRFPLLNALENDFTHSTYRARPWDDKYSTFCGPEGICGTEDPTMLNVTKVIGTDDNEFLVYDDVAYSVDGNNLVPDIPSLDNHTLSGNESFDEDDVIQAIYSDRADDNPYMTMDQLCDYENYDIALETTEPLFTSHADCDTLIPSLSDGAYQAEPVTGARKFTAANSERFIITAPNPGTGDFAFELWFNRDSLVGGGMALFSTGGASGNRGFMLYSGTSKDLIFYMDDGTVAVIDHISPPLTYNVWYHVFVTVDRSGFATCYVNGAFAGQVDVSAAYRSLGSSAGRIGAHISGLHFDGKMACLRYYEGTLPDLDHIASMYSGGTPKKRDDLTAAERTQLVGAWDLDETSGDAIDSEGANDGADYNTVTSASGPYLPAYDMTLVGFTSQARSTDIPSGWAGCKSITANGAGYAQTTIRSDESSVFPFQPTLSGRGAKTVSWAFKHDGVPSTTSFFCCEQSGASSQVGFTSFLLNTGIMYAGLGKGAVGDWLFLASVDLTSYCDGDWHTATITWDGTTDPNTAILYIDATSVDTETADSATTGATSLSEFTWLAKGNGTDIAPSGSICLPVVHAGRAWTQAEVTAYHSAGTIPADVTAFYNANETKVQTDYRDGYPCVSGFQEYDGGEDISRGGLYQDIVDGLSIPTRSATDPTEDYLIQLSSGILNATGLRLDCGCLLYDCDNTGIERLWVAADEEGFLAFDHSSICSLDHYYDQDGELDVSCDHVVVERNMVLEETIGTCSIRLDGTIPTLLETS